MVGNEVKVVVVVATCAWSVGLTGGGHSRDLVMVRDRAAQILY